MWTCSSAKIRFGIEAADADASGPHNVTTFSFAIFICDHRVHASRIPERIVLKARLDMTVVLVMLHG